MLFNVNVTNIRFCGLYLTSLHRQQMLKEFAYHLYSRMLDKNQVRDWEKQWVTVHIEDLPFASPSVLFPGFFSQGRSSGRKNRKFAFDIGTFYFSCLKKVKRTYWTQSENIKQKNGYTTRPYLTGSEELFQQLSISNHSKYEVASLFDSVECQDFVIMECQRE